jgi:hypothetical protein
LDALDINVQREQGLSEVLQEEFKPKLAETESRWTKEGHLEIREEVQPTDIISKDSEEKKGDASDESEDDDF